MKMYLINTEWTVVGIATLSPEQANKRNDRLRELGIERRWRPAHELEIEAGLAREPLRFARVEWL